MAGSDSRALALRPAVAPHSMEMEEGRAGSSSQVLAPVGQAQKDKWHRCFPLRLCLVCDSVPPLNLVTAWVPDTLKVIQDWTHLTCALGMISQIALFVVSVVNFAYFKLHMFTLAHLWSTREIVTLLMVVDIFPYCLSVIGRYDGALMDKKEQQRIEKEKLQKEYNSLFNDMNDKIEAFAENAADFATKIFEDNIRKLSRWAKSVGNTLERESKGMSDEEMEGLREEFITMLMNFAHIIQECGIDPVECPVILFKREELERLGTFKEISDLVQRRCGSTKTAIQTVSGSRKINGWSEQMKGQCPKCKRVYSVAQARDGRGKCQDCSGAAVFFSVHLIEIPAWDLTKPGQCKVCKEWYSPEQALMSNGVCSSEACRQRLEEQRTPLPDLVEVTQLTQTINKFKTDEKQAKKMNRKLTGLDERSQSSVMRLASNARKKCTCCPTWIKCGGGKCGREWSTENKDGWPMNCGCVCMTMKVFSKDHVKLMLGFLLCFVLVGMHTGWITERHLNEDDSTVMDRHRTGYVMLNAALACIVVNLSILLVRFEDIDLVQQLTREIQVLKVENVKVESTREEVKETYGKLQDLNDVWLNRTIPRLELVQRTAFMIENQDVQTSRAHWAMSNAAVQDMEKKIGAIGDWIGSAKLSPEDKKQFRHNIEHVYEEDDLNEVTMRLKMLTGGGQLKKLEGLAPNQSDRPWHPSAPSGSMQKGMSFHGADFLCKRDSEKPFVEA